MIILKTEAEIGLMRQAGEIVADCHELGRKLIEPGLRLADLEAEIDAL